jgi:hypothetical protein
MDVHRTSNRAELFTPTERGDFPPYISVSEEGFGIGEVDQTDYLVGHEGMHDGDGDTLHLGNGKIGDDPVGGVGSADSYMVALLQAEGGEQFRHAADFGIHLAIGIVVAAGGVLGGTVLGEIEIREGGLVPVVADGFREDIEIVFCHQWADFIVITGL